MVACPICGKSVKESNINRHIDSECADFVESLSIAPSTPVASFFKTPAQKKPPPPTALNTGNGFPNGKESPGLRKSKVIDESGTKRSPEGMLLQSERRPRQSSRRLRLSLSA